METIGDCYMACTGLIKPTEEHAALLVGFACEMVAAANTTHNPLTGQVRARGGCIAGYGMVYGYGVIASFKFWCVAWGAAHGTGVRARGRAKHKA